jgi:hypothetical protein
MSNVNLVIHNCGNQKGSEMSDETNIQAHDDEDVPLALERETQDGPGTDDLDSLPESDLEEKS